MASIYETVKKIADSWGVPEYIWAPIMDSESSGNPGSNANTAKEDSRGLFQINVKAHPQWETTNLYDPEINAKLAFQYFIAPAYEEIKNSTSLTDPEKTAYVWKNGIKPKWTAAKNKSIQEKAANVLAGNPLGATTSTKLKWYDPRDWGDMLQDSATDAATGVATGWFQKVMDGIGLGGDLLKTGIIRMVLILVGGFVLWAVVKSMFLSNSPIIINKKGSAEE